MHWEFINDQFGHPGSKPPWGNLTAINLSTGKKIWQIPFGEYEELTDSYNVINLQLGIKLNSQFHCSLGVNNVLNETYTPHISRVRGIAGGVPNPGKSASINLKYEF